MEIPPASLLFGCEHLAVTNLSMDVRTYPAPPAALVPIRFDPYRGVAFIGSFVRKNIDFHSRYRTMRAKLQAPRQTLWRVVAKLQCLHPVRRVYQQDENRRVGEVVGCPVDAETDTEMSFAHKKGYELYSFGIEVLETYKAK